MKAAYLAMSALFIGGNALADCLYTPIIEDKNLTVNIETCVDDEGAVTRQVRVSQPLLEYDRSPIELPTACYLNCY